MTDHRTPGHRTRGDAAAAAAERARQLASDTVSDADGQTITRLRSASCPAPGSTSPSRRPPLATRQGKNAGQSPGAALREAMNRPRRSRGDGTVRSWSGERVGAEVPETPSPR